MITILLRAAALGPMRHTFGPIPPYAASDCTLQIFYIRVTEISKGGLQWPLHVHGLVAVRDSVDHNRNFLFNRTRDDCQTLTQEVSTIYLSVHVCSFLHSPAAI
jgi:hypothetical protein